MTSSPQALAFPPVLFRHTVRSTIRACVTAGVACVGCADACVLDEDSHRLRRCIHLALSCADQCSITIEMLARPVGQSAGQLRARLTRLLRLLVTCESECREHLGQPGCGSTALAVANCARHVRALLDTLTLRRVPEPLPLEGSGPRRRTVIASDAERLPARAAPVARVIMVKRG